jgi:hypothetical protein
VQCFSFDQTKVSSGEKAAASWLWDVAQAEFPGGLHHDLCIRERFLHHTQGTFETMYRQQASIYSRLQAASLLLPRYLSLRAIAGDLSPDSFCLHFA